MRPLALRYHPIGCPMSETEYGHDGYRAGGFFIDSWGAGPYVITARGKQYHFEDSQRFGPMWLDAKGEPKSEFIPEDSPFWPAWERWVAEGRQVTEGKKGRLHCRYTVIGRWARREMSHE